jgi:ABC-type antimicrobial peptide transport system permease subunit
MKESVPGKEMPSHPPRLADRLLGWFCAPHLLEEVQGDLHEEFDYQVGRVGMTKARLRYWRDVLGFARPFAIQRKKTTFPPSPFFHFPMLRSYLTIALRTLWRSKGYTAVNVVGLSVAFCTSLFLLLMAYLQFTFDSFHADGERIFQTYFFANDPEGATRSSSMPLPLMPALKAEYPEVEAAARVMTVRKSLVEYGGKYLDKEVYFTDPDFTRMFSFPLLKGNRETALNGLSSMLVSESLARALFGEEEPIGKQLVVSVDGNRRSYLVTGVLADAPYNSSIHYEALVRIENLPGYRDQSGKWDGYSHRVFVKLAPGADKDAFEKRLTPFARKYFPNRLAELKGKGAKPDARGDLFALRLQQLADVHFDREVSDGKGVSMALIYMLVGIAVFVLLIACINFVNLSVARSFTRAREVGVRKTLGALKGQLFTQIWGESVLIYLGGMVVGAMLAYLLLPAFNATFHTRLDLGHAIQPGFLAVMLGMFAAVTLLAGGYPAWQMTKFNPVTVLKGKVSLKQPGVLRNGLLVVQFVISSLFACCTVVALQQLAYLRAQPLGFEKELVVSIPVGNHTDGRQVLQRLRDKLAADPAVLAVTGSGVNLGKGKDRVTSRSVIDFTYRGKKVASDWLVIDYDYLKTLNIKLLAGREFDPAYASDSVGRVIITESMAKMLGEKDPVGKLFGDDEDQGTKYQVIGLVPDFYLYSVTSETLPITMRISHTAPIHYVFVRVAPQSLAGSMEKLQRAWKEVAPQTEFMGSFLDQNVDAWYETEERLSQVFSLAAGLTIVLSCLGLFAVALLVIEQRTKEIGIRKVLGASIAGIVFTLSKGFVRLVLVALAVALPLAWFLVGQWLKNYPVRTEVSGWVFAGVGVAALLLALGTVSFHSIKAALANPVKALRSE